MAARNLCCAFTSLVLMTWLCPAHWCAGQDRVDSDVVKNTGDEEAILAAIAKGDLAELQRLESVLQPLTISNLGSYAWNSPNAEVIIYLRDKQKIVASELQIAAVKGDAKQVRTLLQQFQNSAAPPDSEERYRSGPNFGYLAFTSNTPLRLAIRRGHVDVVRALIAGGANVNERLVEARRHRSLNEYPLSEAVNLGRTEIVQLLVAGKALLEDPAITYAQKGPKLDGYGSLTEFYRTHFTSPPAVVQQKLQELVAAGQLVEEPDPDANVVCPLVIAIRTGRAKIASILLNAGSNPNTLIGTERRPLHEAVLKGNPEVVRLLIEKGADVNAPTVDGKSTPLSLAVGYEHGDIADILRAAGAK